MIVYRDAVPADGPELSAMAKRCFSDTFGTLYRPSDLAAFLDSAFGARGLPAQLDDGNFTVRIAREEGAVAGFAKVGPVAFPGEWTEEDLELYQLYVLGAWQGGGVGPALIGWAIETARARGKRRLVLSVFVDNHRAQRFYTRYGFREIGRITFPVGEHLDEDMLMVLDL